MCELEIRLVFKLRQIEMRQAVGVGSADRGRDENYEHGGREL
jgi:hypothetical protein